MSDDTIKQVLLSDIDINTAWNSRGSRWMKDSEGEPDEREDGRAVLTGTRGLQATIAKKGQDTPIDLVTEHPKKDPKKKYFLVCGFRRIEAVRRIWEQHEKEKSNGDHYPPTILARIRNLTPYESRALNMRENVVREEIPTADLAFGAHEMVEEAHGEGRKITQQEIADELSLSVGYVSKLMKVMADTDPKITARWRTAILPLSLNDMHEVSLKPKSEQEQEYKRILKEKLIPPKPLGKGWTVHARRSAIRMGDLFGTLEAQGYLRMMIKGGEPVLFTEHTIRAIVKIKSGKNPVSPRQLKGIAETANHAYQAALVRVNKEEGVSNE